VVQDNSHAALCVGCELVAAILRVAGDQVVEPGLVDGHLAPVQSLDLGGVDIDADDMVSGIRQTRPCNQANVARTEDRHAHLNSLPMPLAAAAMLGDRKGEKKRRRPRPARKSLADDQFTLEKLRETSTRACATLVCVVAVGTRAVQRAEAIRGRPWLTAFENSSLRHCAA